MLDSLVQASVQVLQSHPELAVYLDAGCNLKNYFAIFVISGILADLVILLLICWGRHFVPQTPEL